MPVYLGLDLSTQSVSAVAIEVDPAACDGGGTRETQKREVVCELSLPFDEILPAYGTSNGVLPSDLSSEGLSIAHSSPLMWADALDCLLAALRDQGLDLSRVRAIAGSGQQHGSVYLNDTVLDVLRGLDPGRPLAEQLAGVFSRATSPIWMDSSTAMECREITNSLGGFAAVAELTGSRAFERFTGPQIRKFYKDHPGDYAGTDTIHLVSSYMASLLAGTHAPIDPGDGAGMNLMDIRARDWAPLALAATAPGVSSKLPPIAPSSKIIGPVSGYFARRHGLPSDARVVVWSGDNPCSLIGVGLVSEGCIAISLGTSDTLFGFMPEVRVDPAGEGHVFGSPTGHAMSLICFHNGSLAREKVRDRLGLDWAGFSRALTATPAGNLGRVMLPWFDPEITPAVPEAGERLHGFDDDLDENDGAALARAVVEGQMASMVLHSRWMGVRTRTIHATGGASSNREILQIMADVHGAAVYPFRVGNSAALGAALRAWHADRSAEGESPEWTDVVAGLAEPLREARVEPDPAAHELYRDFVELYRVCEDHALRNGADPGPLRRKFSREWASRP